MRALALTLALALAWHLGLALLRRRLKRGPKPSLLGLLKLAELDLLRSLHRELSSAVEKNPWLNVRLQGVESRLRELEVEDGARA